MLNDKVLSILTEGYKNQNATTYIESRKMLEQKGYTITKRKVYDSDNNDLGYLHSYCYKLGMMLQKKPTKSISKKKQVSDEVKLSESLNVLTELANKYGVKMGLSTQTFENVSKKIQKARENELIELEIAKTEKAKEIDNEIARLIALKKAL